MTSHPSKRLDDAVHQRTRLGILAVLCESGQADFTFLRRTLELTDGNLSRSLSRLEESGYVAIEKVIDGNRLRTWVSATPAGRGALTDEIDALCAIIARVEIARVEKPSRARSAVRPREA